MSPEDLKKQMRKLGVTLPEELEGRQYSFVEAEPTYCPDGTFKVDRMIDTVGAAYHRSIKEGYAGRPSHR